MKKYIMLNHGAGSLLAWEHYIKMLHDKGRIVGGAPLDGGLSVRNGEFGAAESASVTGYVVIQAADLEEAKELTLLNPTHQAGGTVELFPLA